MQSNKKIYIIDLDNTIYDTWPTLKSRKKNQSIFGKLISEHIRLWSLKKFPRIYALINKRSKDNSVVFLSARRSIFFLVTYLKLLFELRHLRFKLILVNNAHDKLPIILKYAAHTCNLVVIDDLSYNHENGCVLIYKELIHQLFINRVRLISGERLRKIQ